jgi:hypothetical protein
MLVVAVAHPHRTTTGDCWGLLLLVLLGCPLSHPKCCQDATAVTTGATFLLPKLACLLARLLIAVECVKKPLQTAAAAEVSLRLTSSWRTQLCTAYVTEMTNAWCLAH